LSSRRRVATRRQSKLFETLLTPPTPHRLYQPGQRMDIFIRPFRQRIMHFAHRVTGEDTHDLCLVQQQFERIRHAFGHGTVRDQ
jgi:hypothetical protein